MTANRPKNLSWRQVKTSSQHIMKSKHCNRCISMQRNMVTGMKMSWVQYQIAYTMACFTWRRISPVDQAKSSEVRLPPNHLSKNNLMKMEFLTKITYPWYIISCHDMEQIFNKFCRVKTISWAMLAFLLWVLSSWIFLSSYTIVDRSIMIWNQIIFSLELMTKFHESKALIKICSRMWVSNSLTLAWRRNGVIARRAST